MPSGLTKLLTPSTEMMLKMQLPTTFPTAMSRCPRAAAATVVAISGNDVPTATTVRPISSSLTPSAVAMATAPSTSQREPRTSRPSPNTMSIRSNRIPEKVAAARWAYNSGAAARSAATSRRLLPIKNTV